MGGCSPEARVLLGRAVCAIALVFTVSAAGVDLQSLETEELSKLFEINPEAVSQLREMAYPAGYKADDEEDLWPAGVAEFYANRNKKSHNFKNPFIFKKDAAEDREAKQDPATPRHFFRSPFILKRNGYQRLPFILKRFGFKNPFVFKREQDDPQEEQEDVNERSAMRGMFQNPSIFKRLFELQNGEEEEMHNMY